MLIVMRLLLLLFVILAPDLILGRAAECCRPAGRCSLSSSGHLKGKNAKPFFPAVLQAVLRRFVLRMETRSEKGICW